MLYIGVYEIFIFIEKLISYENFFYSLLFEMFYILNSNNSYGNNIKKLYEIKIENSFIIKKYKMNE